MKKSILMGAVVALAATATAVQAANVTFHGDNAYRQGNGGEFQARVWSGNAGKTGMFSDIGPSVPGGRTTPGAGNQAYTSFQTFCLELGENVDLNPGSPQNPVNQVTVSVAPYAVSGGGGSIIEDGQSRDYIGDRTAFLYTQFRRGTLDQYTYNNGAPVGGMDRSNTARALQLAFWFLENEVATISLSGGNGAGGDSGVYNLALYYAGLTSTYGSGLSMGGWTGMGNVRVINYLRTNGEPGQSMLTLIPLPTAGGLAMAGLLGCGMTRRRFN